MSHSRIMNYTPKAFCLTFGVQFIYFEAASLIYVSDLERILYQ